MRPVGKCHNYLALPVNYRSSSLCYSPENLFVRPVTVNVYSFNYADIGTLSGPESSKTSESDMKKHRATLLMAVLLALAGYYVFWAQPQLGYYVLNSHQIPVIIQAGTGPEKPLDGASEIRKISIKPTKSERYVVDVEYRYRGELNLPRLRVYPLSSADVPSPGKTPWIVKAERGVNNASVPMSGDISNKFAHSTRLVRVELFDWITKQVVASRDVEYPIDWPSTGSALTSEQDMAKDVAILYKEAVAEIDYSSKYSLDNARKKLEIILSKDPQFVAAYPEMARFYMKTNWGPEGLQQSERALKTGLAIDPNHADSLVLLGYVYTHQRRYREALEAFKKASEIGTDNLWLWGNWGELLLMQGKVSDSIAMYRKAIENDRRYNTYDRARKDAYRHLIDIYIASKDTKAADALHLKRIAEYRSELCYPYYYAKFRQRNFDDPDIVLEYAKNALSAGCEKKEDVRKVIGIGYYSKWLSAATPDVGQSYLNQARLLFPEGSLLIYQLAYADTTTSVIQRLVGEGISIDVRDNHGMTALAYAVKDDNFEAVKRLIDMGGNPNAVVGDEKIPLLAVAVLGESEETIRYLVAKGADVNAQVGGVSIVELAERMGYHKIAEVLKKGGGTRL
jgi:tetratricopeptide (TPR) repeat protein